MTKDVASSGPQYSTKVIYYLAKKIYYKTPATKQFRILIVHYSTVEFILYVCTWSHDIVLFQITMLHYDLPFAVKQKTGGWTEEGIIDAFTEYADFLFKNFGDRVITSLFLPFHEHVCDSIIRID